MTLYLRWVIVPIVLLLCLPLIATSLSPAVDWSAFDFLAAGLLLLTFATAIFWIATRWQAPRRWFVVGLVAIAFLLVWAELAVGVFGTPFAGS